jgi:protein phosphatase
MPDWAWVLIVVASSIVTYLVANSRSAGSAAPPQSDRRSPEPEPAPAAPAPAPAPAAAPPPVVVVASSSPRLAPSSSPKVAPPARAQAQSRPSLDLPNVLYEEDEDVDPTLVGATKAAVAPVQPPTNRIVYDEDAAPDEPTHAGDLILLTATAQTDKGLRRKRNEDSLLVLEEEGLFVVADGMGGYNGGEIASSLAVETIGRAFSSKSFAGEAHATIPWRASELARAIQMANDAIFSKAQGEPRLKGMGTTICAARFAPRKQRLYIGHVGDSRMYRLRGSTFEQITKDHTMRDFGVTGEGSSHLSRAVGVWPTVPIDVIIGKPLPGDVYVLCSDGLTKMIPDAELRKILIASAKSSAEEIVQQLVARANEAGGKDNITVILIQVRDAVAAMLSRAARQTA